MSTKFNRILFDYDGTILIHDKENEGEQIAKILGLDEEQIPEFSKRLEYLFSTSYGKQYYSNRKMTYELYSYIIENIIRPKMFGISVREFDDAVNEKCRTGAHITPHAKETFEYLMEKGYEICLLTNGFYSYQTQSMKYHGIFDYFERIYAWDGFYAKPDKRAFKRALAGTEPSSNIMVGDSITSDIIPAKEMGLFTIGVNLRDINNQKVQPHLTITDIAEIKNFL